MNCLKHVRPGKGYIPRFELFSKIKVNGDDANELFKWLKYTCPRPTERVSFRQYVVWKPILVTDIEWNFEEFLIDHRGRPVRRFSADTLPLEYEKDIVEAIKECKKDS